MKNIIICIENYLYKKIKLKAITNYHYKQVYKKIKLKDKIFAYIFAYNAIYKKYN